MNIQTIKIRPDETVLIVDDDRHARIMLRDLIENAGPHCHEAGDADEALEMMAKCAFDLVLTDMNMPGCSGLDLIDRIRQMDHTIPVILITGYASVDSAVDAMKRGAVDVISKPFDMHIVKHLVDKALEERRLRRENQRLQADVNKAAVIENLNRRLNAQLDELTRLYSISEAMNRFMDTEAIFEHAVQIAARVTGARRVSLMLLDRGRRHLRIRAAIGVPPSVVRHARVRIGEGIAGRVAQTRKALRAVNEATGEPAEIGSGGDGYESRYWLSLPLFIGEELFGVLNLTDKIDRVNFSEKDEQIVEFLLHKASVKLENQALYEGIYANLVDTLSSLVTTIEAKDPYTHKHSQRVTAYAVRIAEILGIGGGDLEMLDFAGLLHDIGKIGVHDEILTKTGRLSSEEFNAIKQHPLIGERIVAPLGLSPIERSIIRNHHERIDGRGYPDGLKGDKIPFLARIVGVADAFDAMTTTRSYRRALSVEHAVDELVRNRDAQFDGDVVKAALEAIERGLMPLEIADTPIFEKEAG